VHDKMNAEQLLLIAGLLPHNGCNRREGFDIFIGGREWVSPSN